MATLSQDIERLASVLEAPGAVPSQPLIDAFYRLGLRTQQEGPAGETAAAVAKAVHGKDLVWIELLRQPHFAEHPSLSADVFKLMAATVGVKKSSAIKNLNADAIAAAIDASVRCEIAETAQAASGLLVALARQPLVHLPVFASEKDILGCIFALHDRTDNVSGKRRGGSGGSSCDTCTWVRSPITHGGGTPLSCGRSPTGRPSSRATSASASLCSPSRRPCRRRRRSGCCGRRAGRTWCAARVMLRQQPAAPPACVRVFRAGALVRRHGSGVGSTLPGLLQRTVQRTDRRRRRQRV